MTNSGPHADRYARPVSGLRRVLIDWDYGAHGIWRVLSKEEKEGPALTGRWSGAPPPGGGPRPRPWSDRLSAGLLDDLRAWNDDCEDGGDVGVLRQRGRDLAVRVQEELGMDGWEVLYQMGDRMHRVHPPGSWPISSWRQELLGYSERRPQ